MNATTTKNIELSIAKIHTNSMDKITAIQIIATRRGEHIGACIFDNITNKVVITGKLKSQIAIEFENFKPLILQRIKSHNQLRFAKISQNKKPEIHNKKTGIYQHTTALDHETEKTTIVSIPRIEKKLEKIEKLELPIFSIFHASKLLSMLENINMEKSKYDFIHDLIFGRKNEKKTKKVSLKNDTNQIIITNEIQRQIDVFHQKKARLENSKMSIENKRNKLAISFKFQTKSMQGIVENKVDLIDFDQVQFEQFCYRAKIEIVQNKDYGLKAKLLQKLQAKIKDYARYKMFDDQTFAIIKKQIKAFDQTIETQNKELEKIERYIEKLNFQLIKNDQSKLISSSVESLEKLKHDQVVSSIIERSLEKIEKFQQNHDFVDIFKEDQISIINHWFEILEISISKNDKLEIIEILKMVSFSDRSSSVIDLSDLKFETKNDFKKLITSLKVLFQITKKDKIIHYLNSLKLETKNEIELFKSILKQIECKNDHQTFEIIISKLKYFSGNDAISSIIAHIEKIYHESNHVWVETGETIDGVQITGLKSDRNRLSTLEKIKESIKKVEQQITQNKGKNREKRLLSLLQRKVRIEKLLDQKGRIKPKQKAKDKGGKLKLSTEQKIISKGYNFSKIIMKYFRENYISISMLGCNEIEIKDKYDQIVSILEKLAFELDDQMIVDGKINSELVYFLLDKILRKNKETIELVDSNVSSYVYDAIIETASIIFDQPRHNSVEKTIEKHIPVSIPIEYREKQLDFELKNFYNHIKTKKAMNSICERIESEETQKKAFNLVIEDQKKNKRIEVKKTFKNSFQAVIDQWVWLYEINPMKYEFLEYSQIEHFYMIENFKYNKIKEISLILGYEFDQNSNNEIIDIIHSDILKNRGDVIRSNSEATPQKKLKETIVKGSKKGFHFSYAKFNEVSNKLEIHKAVGEHTKLQYREFSINSLSYYDLFIDFLFQKLVQFIEKNQTYYDFWHSLIGLSLSVEFHSFLKLETNKEVLKDLGLKLSQIKDWSILINELKQLIDLNFKSKGFYNPLSMIKSSNSYRKKVDNAIYEFVSLLEKKNKEKFKLEYGVEIYVSLSSLFSVENTRNNTIEKIFSEKTLSSIFTIWDRYEYRNHRNKDFCWKWKNAIVKNPRCIF